MSVEVVVCSVKVKLARSPEVEDLIRQRIGIDLKPGGHHQHKEILRQDNNIKK